MSTTQHFSSTDILVACRDLGLCPQAWFAFESDRSFRVRGGHVRGRDEPDKTRFLANLRPMNFTVRQVISRSLKIQGWLTQKRRSHLWSQS